MTTLAFYKVAKERAEFYADWPAQAQAPQNQLFGGTLTDLEATGLDCDSDDAAP